MSVSRYMDVWCDNERCPCWEETAPSKTNTEAREIAEKLGWRVNLPGGRDLCPDCASGHVYGARRAALIRFNEQSEGG